jgi:hypothetical protein
MRGNVSAIPFEVSVNIIVGEAAERNPHEKKRK